MAGSTRENNTRRRMNVDSIRSPAHSDLAARGHARTCGRAHGLYLRSLRADSWRMPVGCKIAISGAAHPSSGEPSESPTASPSRHPTNRSARGGAVPELCPTSQVESACASREYFRTVSPASIRKQPVSVGAFTLTSGAADSHTGARPASLAAQRACRHAGKLRACGRPGAHQASGARSNLRPTHGRPTTPSRLRGGGWCRLHTTASAGAPCGSSSPPRCTGWSPSARPRPAARNLASPPTAR